MSDKRDQESTLLLMDASLDMYQALKAMLALAGPGENHDCDVCNVCEAISMGHNAVAKAEGRGRNGKR